MSFPFDAYLGNNSAIAANPVAKTIQENVHENKSQGLQMSPALEWAFRYKHSQDNNIVTNLPGNTGTSAVNNIPNNNQTGIDLRRRAGDNKQKVERKLEIDSGFFFRYLPFLLLVLVIIYFYMTSGWDTKSTKTIEGIYKPNEALLYARNIACEIQPI